MWLPATRPTRRAVLRAASAGAALAAAGPLVGGCSRTPDGPDELEPVLAAARADAARADAAGGAFGGLATAMGEVARVRRAHADALAAEIRRARPDRRPAVDAVTTPGGEATAAVTAAGGAGAAATVVAGPLGTARDAALALAPAASRYRCGLLASVAAACGGLTAALEGTGS